MLELAPHFETNFPLTAELKLTLAEYCQHGLLLLLPISWPFTECVKYQHEIEKLRVLIKLSGITVVGILFN